MISFFRKFIQKRVDAAVAVASVAITENVRAQNAAYIKSLEADNELLRLRVGNFSIEGTPDKFYTYFFELNTKIRKSKPGDVIDCILKLGTVEVIKCETVINPEYKNLKEYKLTLIDTTTAAKTHIYGSGEYWYFDEARKDIIHDRNSPIKNIMKELSNFNFFPALRGYNSDE